ncbi:MAG: hypothetical protein AB8E82_19045 [Aureispira sp.]
MRKCVLMGMLGASIALSACFKEEEPGEPAYIRVEGIQLAVDANGSQGAGTSNITDAWISVDGQQLGAGSFPATFPVILDENFTTNSIRISPGIKNNGITNTRAIYPFYESYIITDDLEPGEVFTVSPTVQYDSRVEIEIVDDFENPNQPIFTVDLDNNPNTSIVSQSDDVLTGAYSGRITIDDNNLECTAASSVRFSNLTGVTAVPVYIEMDYKTNVPIQVGLRAHYSPTNTDAIYKGGVNDSKGAWRKIYFEFTREVFGSNAPEYSVLLRAVRTPGISNPEVLIDNIKLVYF